MQTIDVTPQTKQMPPPKNWGKVADRLGVSRTTVTNCRNDLGASSARLTPGLFEQIRRMVRFCDLRNNGGGVFYTRQNYIDLMERDPEELERILKECEII